MEPVLLTPDSAQALLVRFTCIEPLPLEELPANEEVRQALLLIREHSDYQIFGICAETAEHAIATLHTYLKALGYSDAPNPESIPGPVYLKFNPKTGRCHLDAYTGHHRGVLVSCQSSYDGDVNGTFGHLPLELFSEDG